MTSVASTEPEPSLSSTENSVRTNTGRGQRGAKVANKSVNRECKETENASGVARECCPTDHVEESAGLIRDLCGLEIVIDQPLMRLLEL